MERLTNLTAGMPIVYDGDKVTHVPAEIAESFVAGDRLVVVQATGDLLHVPAEVARIADDAVARAHAAFLKLGGVGDDAVDAFYEAFARRLEDDVSFAPIAAANAADVESARSRGRSVTRLILDEKMRRGMIDGLRGWATAPSIRGSVQESVGHDGWRVDQVVAGLGVVGFVFEGRPNVFADATGVLRGGNAVVFRIGSDALGTAEAIVEHALDPALAEAGLPAGAASLVASASRAAGWAMFSNRSLALAVARGSGAAVAQLGSVAQQAGIPVSLHGTGGTWIVAGEDATADDLGLAVYHSLDRKVCNTLNTCAIPAARVDLIPAVLDALQRAGERRGTNGKLHVAEGSEGAVPAEWFERVVPIARAEGLVEEPHAEPISRSDLGVEWEWEDSPEITLVVVDSVDEAVTLFNEQSPHFAASLISADAGAQQAFFDAIDAPFVGNGFTRWVDGQYALDRPELGLSNWQMGRLFARGGVLSGDSVFTIRSRVTQDHMDIGR
ncbi:MAG: glutamate-5-semialdehyde dehydrogenase [Acidimicrobiia bacterium]|nr:MAG: glutamate-5-semialdehyde dehydrogenase [Acidimicrobiia bacterium]